MFQFSAFFSFQYAKRQLLLRYYSYINLLHRAFIQCLFIIRFLFFRSGPFYECCACIISIRNLHLFLKKVTPFFACNSYSFPVQCACISKKRSDFGFRCPFIIENSTDSEAIFRMKSLYENVSRANPPRNFSNTFRPWIKQGGHSNEETRCPGSFPHARSGLHLCFRRDHRSVRHQARRDPAPRRRLHLRP